MESLFEVKLESKSLVQHTLTEHDPAAASFIKICQELSDPVAYNALLSVMKEPK